MASVAPWDSAFTLTSCAPSMNNDETANMTGNLDMTFRLTTGFEFVSYMSGGRRNIPVKFSKRAAPRSGIFRLAAGMIGTALYRPRCQTTPLLVRRHGRDSKAKRFRT